MVSEAIYIILIYYFLIGIVIGFMSTTIGLGGSILAVLILLFDIDNSLALDFTTYEKSRVIIANTMIALIATNTAVAMRRRQSLKISKDMLFTLTIPAILSAIGITWLIISFDILPLYLFTLLFLGMMVFTTITIFKNKGSSFGSSCRVNGIGERFRLIATSTISGIVTALTATESSPVVVPVLNERCGFTIDKAVNVFSMIFYFVSLSIGIMYFLAQPAIEIPFPGIKIGYVVIAKAIPMALGSFITSYIGYDLFKKTNLRYVAYITTFILSLFMLRVFFMDIIKPLY